MQEDITRDVLERLRAGDAGAFEDLVTAYQHRVFAVAYRMLGNRAEAEEAVQEVFLRAYRALGDFRGEARLSTWLYAITSRLCLSRLGSAKRRLAHVRDEALLDGLVSAETSVATALEQREQQAALQRAISELPNDRRILVVLRDLEGLSYEEISQTLDLTLGTVRSRLHRARLELREKLEKLLP
jgi:RNA polymerase sigma-70 factor (ECF subfamily)